jgi:hypothetical protein
MNTDRGKAEYVENYTKRQEVYGRLQGLEQERRRVHTRLLRLTEARLPSCPYHSQGVLLGAQTLRPARSGQPVPYMNLR